MANHVSSIKRNRQAQRRRLRSASYKSAIKTQVRSFLSLVNEKKTTELKTELSKTVSLLHRAAAKGVITKSHASRKTASLTKLARSLIK